MNILGSSIRAIRMSKKLTQKDLAELTGFKQNTISNHENGNRTLDEVDIMKYAEALNVSPQSLFNYNKNQSSSKEDKTLTQITSISATLVDFRQKKVLDYATAQKREQDSGIRENNVTYLSDYIEAKREGFVAAGTGQYVLDDHKEMVTIPSSILPKKSYDLMLQVKGDSMLPTFKDDEFVFVKKSTNIHNGQFGVFRINNESYIKKVYIENERLKLVSLNPSYPDLFFDETDDIELVGVVVM